jgi:hypothetical protein
VGLRSARAHSGPRKRTCEKKWRWLLCVAVRRGGLASHKVWGWDDLIRFCRGKAHLSPRCWQWNKVGAVRTPTEPKKGNPRPWTEARLALPPTSGRAGAPTFSFTLATRHPHIWNLQYRRDFPQSGIGGPEIRTVHSTKHIHGFAININGRQCRYIVGTLCNIDLQSQQLQGTRQHSEAIKKPTADYARIPVPR